MILSTANAISGFNFRIPTFPIPIHASDKPSPPPDGAHSVGHLREVLAMVWVVAGRPVPAREELKHLPVPAQEPTNLGEGKDDLPLTSPHHFQPDSHNSLRQRTDAFLRCRVLH